MLASVAALLAAGSAAPRPFANSGEVSDPAGDSGPAPDLTTIALLVRAGQKLSVAVGVWTDDEHSPKTSCRARIGRKTVTGKPAWAPILVPSPLPDWDALSRKGVASCRFAVPRKARGKTINVTMAMTKEGVTLREVFSQKIR